MFNGYRTQNVEYIPHGGFALFVCPCARLSICLYFFSPPLGAKTFLILHFSDFVINLALQKTQQISHILFNHKKYSSLVFCIGGVAANFFFFFYNFSKSPTKLNSDCLIINFKGTITIQLISV